MGVVAAGEKKSAHGSEEISVHKRVAKYAYSSNVDGRLGTKLLHLMASPGG